jgi:hypothetical protein
LALLAAGVAVLELLAVPVLLELDEVSLDGLLSVELLLASELVDLASDDFESEPDVLPLLSSEPDLAEPDPGLP